MALLLNFSISRGNTRDVVVDASAVVSGESLEGATVFWSAWQQAHGVVATDSTGARLPPVISKVTNHGVTNPGSPPMEFVIHFDAADTVNLDGNYYHEAEAVDEGGNHVTVMQGVMTVTEAEITQ